jgi:hypothetical protein
LPLLDESISVRWSLNLDSIGKEFVMPASYKFAIGISLGAAFIFAAAFMPWGVISGAPKISAPFGLGDAFGEMLAAVQMSVTVTAWNGSINLGNLSLPNWLVVLAAASLAAVAWLKALDIWSAPAFVPFSLAGYGLFHAGDFLISLMIGSNSKAGVGSFLTAVTFIGLLVMLVQQARAPLPAKPASFGDELPPIGGQGAMPQ